MNQDKDPVGYQSPPRHWPFPVLGRNTFLALGAFLLAVILLPFWGSIAVAAVFAFGLSHPTEYISRKFGGRRRLTAGLLVGALTLLLLFPASLLGIRTYQIATAPKEQNISGLFSEQTLDRLSGAYTKVESWAVEYGVGSKLFESPEAAKDSIRHYSTQAATKVLAVIPALFTGLPELALSLLVFGLFLYVFLAHPVEIRRFTFRLHIFKPDDLKRSIKILKSSSYDSLVANFVVGALQATVITLGARFLGFKESVLIFSVVFVISYIPFIGAGPVGYLIALVMLLTDGATPAIIMAVIATVAGVVDNIARPYLVSSGENEIHPVLSFAAILGAIGVLGLKGIFLGPVILTATVALLGRKNTDAGAQAEIAS